LFWHENNAFWIIEETLLGEKISDEDFKEE